MLLRLAQRRKFLALMAGAFAGSLASVRAHAAVEKPKLTIAVGGKSLFYYLPLTIAEQLGFFKRQGLEVTIHDFAGGAKALQALVGGSADFVAGSFEHAINMHAKGQAIQAIVLLDRYPAIVLALPKQRAASYRSGKDLRGLKVGVTAPGSSTNMFVSNLLAKDGLKPDAVSIIGVGGGAGAVAAMRNGEIDAIAHLDPVIHQLEASGAAVAVVDTRTAQGAQTVYGGAYHAACMYGRTQFIQTHPDTAQALVNAMVQALRWLQNSTPEQIIAAVPPAYYGGDKDGYRAALKKNFAILAPDGVISVEGARNVYRVLKAFEPALQKTDVDLARTYDNRFVRKALAASLPGR